MSKDWFASWFDSPYYHILYKNRDLTEAKFFLDNLIRFLDLPKGSKILDLACGKGRHAIQFNSNGFDVTGADLSPQSIAHANQFKNDSLRFEIHDMREVLRPNAFHVVANLFTSFGYFEDRADNEKVIDSVSQMLQPNGLFVFDFLNPDFVIKRLVTEEVKEIEDITFKISKQVINGQIIKSIDFTDNDKTYHFEEKVWAIDYSTFEEMFTKHRLKIKHAFGEYDLSEFDKENSSRLILIAEKQ